MAMKKRTFTNEQQAQIAEDYESNLPLVAICSKWGMSADTMYDVLDEFYKSKGQTRPAKKRIYKNTTNIKCEHCGALAPVGAKFCPYCGKSIKTEAEKMADKVLWLRAELLHYLPQDSRKQYDEAFLAVKDYIIGGGRKIMTKLQDFAIRFGIVMTTLFLWIGLPQIIVNRIVH